METSNEHLDDILNMSYSPEKADSKAEGKGGKNVEARIKALEKDILYWQDKV